MTLSTTISLRDAFEIYLQYAISCYLDKEFMRDTASHPEDYFTPAIRKVEDSITGRKEFLLRSAIWEYEFKRDLEQYPMYRSWTRSAMMDECEACQRMNHPASFEVSLEGIYYNSENLWKGLEMVSERRTNDH